MNVIAKILKGILGAIIPWPPYISDADDLKRDCDAEIARVRALGPGNAQELLEAARQVIVDEDGRKAGAEGRATTFLAAVAALIPLLTWALGSSTPACIEGWGCNVWHSAFAMSVLYLTAAAFWSQRVLAVSNYYVTPARVAPLRP